MNRIKHFYYWLRTVLCRHKKCSIFTIEGDECPRLGCDRCGKDFGYISY